LFYDNFAVCFFALLSGCYCDFSAFWHAVLAGAHSVKIYFSGHLKSASCFFVAAFISMRRYACGRYFYCSDFCSAIAAACCGCTATFFCDLTVFELWARRRNIDVRRYFKIFTACTAVFRRIAGAALLFAKCRIIGTAAVISFNAYGRGNAYAYLACRLSNCADRVFRVITAITASRIGDHDLAAAVPLIRHINFAGRKSRYTRFFYVNI